VFQYREREPVQSSVSALHDARDPRHGGSCDRNRLDVGYVCCSVR
jgi:hypothetical protein